MTYSHPCMSKTDIVILAYYALVFWFVILQGCHDYNIQAPWVILDED